MSYVRRNGNGDEGFVEERSQRKAVAFTLFLFFLGPGPGYWSRPLDGARVNRWMDFLASACLYGGLVYLFTSRGRDFGDRGQ